MRQKGMCLSLLSLILIITMLITGAICTLIFLSFQRSMESFESYIIRNNQQEMDSVVQAFAIDLQSLLKQLNNILYGKALKRLRQYYTSGIYNYSFLVKCDEVQNQLRIIDNSMSIADETKIYLLNEKRLINSGSVNTLKDFDIDYIMQIIENNTQRIVISNNKIIVYLIVDHFDDLEVYRSYSAHQALKIIKSMRFDLVMTDVFMPEMNGLELIEQIQYIWPKCQYIILTAHDNFSYAYEALRYEHVDYVLKVESYDTICECVAKRLDLIRNELMKEEKLQRLELVGSSMSGFFLKRIIIQGIQLPDQRDLDSFEIPLQMNQPVLPVLMALDDSNPIRYNQSARELVASIRINIESYGLTCSEYISFNTILLDFQTELNREINGSEVIYIYNELEQISNIAKEFTGHTLSIIYSDQMLSWEQSHARYQQASMLLEDIRSDGGVICFSSDDVEVHIHDSDYPSMDELNALWETAKSGNTSRLLTMLHQGFCQLVNPDKLVTSLPNSSVSAISYLASEIIRLYAPDKLEGLKTKTVLACFEYSNLNCWLCDVVALIDSAFEIHSEARQSKKNWLIKRICQYMEEHYQEDITLSLLAEKMHYSPSYLSRFFKAITGTNVITYLYRIRIAKAQKFLIETNDKMSVIAQKTGFCSTQYFNRVFKKHTGMTPTQYRARH